MFQLNTFCKIICYLALPRPIDLTCRFLFEYVSIDQISIGSYSALARVHVGDQASWFHLQTRTQFHLSFIPLSMTYVHP